VFIEDIKMFRILGFLIGSATSIAIILLVMGVPEFHARDAAIDQQRFDAAVEKLMAKKLDVGDVAIDPDEISLPGDIPTHEAAEPVADESQHEAENSELPFAAPDSAALAETDDSPAVPEEPPLLSELQWYSFWNPFRSEIAASGFVAQLERVTGIDYRVVKIKPGVYEVAFAYDDDAERHAKLSQISAATGLDLPDS
jgi:hypothetical protein